MPLVWAVRLVVGGVMTYHSSRQEQKHYQPVHKMFNYKGVSTNKQDNKRESKQSNRHTQPYVFADHSSAATYLH